MPTPIILALAVATLLLPDGLRAQDLGTRLDSALHAAEARGFSGVVRVDRDGATLLEKGYGLANRAARRPFTSATIVQIGSNTKDFTAVALLQLQAQGRVSLRDTLGRYFPHAPSDKRGITLDQLLDHRAGFPLGLGGDFEPVTRQMLIDSAMRHPLRFAPGAQRSYSNTGYGLLAAIIEQVTGRPYDAYVRDAILAPLGLHHTGFLLPAFDPDSLAHGYRSDGTDAGIMLARPHAPDGPWWNLRGNGGMLSTVDDMHAFYAALFDGEQLLTRSARGDRFDPARPVALAGSDMVNFFLYEREPSLRTEIIIASTNQAMPAPLVRRELATLLGLPDGDQRRMVMAPAGREDTPPPAPVAAVLRELVATINAADSARAHRFIADHFAAPGEAATIGARARRMAGMRGELGMLRILAMDAQGGGPVDVSLASANGEQVLFRADVERTAPYRIRGLRVEVGGPD